MKSPRNNVAKADNKVPKARKQTCAKASSGGGGGGGTAAAVVNSTPRSTTACSVSVSSDPSGVPVRPLSAYNFFFREERSKWLAEHMEQEAFKPVMERGSLNNSNKKDGGSNNTLFCSMGKEIGRRWKALSPDQVAIYKEMAAEDAARYKRERKLYVQRETQKAWDEYEVKSSSDNKNLMEASRVDYQSHGVEAVAGAVAGEKEDIHRKMDGSSAEVEVVVMDDLSDCSHSVSSANANAQVQYTKSLSSSPRGVGELGSMGQQPTKTIAEQQHEKSFVPFSQPIVTSQYPVVPFPNLYYPTASQPQFVLPSHHQQQQQPSVSTKDEIIASLVRDNMLFQQMLAQYQQKEQKHPIFLVVPPTPQQLAHNAHSPFLPPTVHNTNPLPRMGEEGTAGIRMPEVAASPRKLSPEQFPLLSKLSPAEVSYLLGKF